MKRRILALVIGLVMVFSLSACKKTETPQATPTPPPPTATPAPTPEATLPAEPEITVEPETDETGEANEDETAETDETAEDDAADTGETAPVTPSVSEDGLIGIEGVAFESPIIVTSVGQSADVNIVDTLLKRIGVEADMSATLTASALRSSVKTLVLAIGGSAKGLGAAGIDENEEMSRVDELIAKAQENGVQILAMHIGGSARRGALSDLFIPNAIIAADAAIIVSEGDTDNYMREMLIENSIPGIYIENQLESTEPLKLLFGK